MLINFKTFLCDGGGGGGKEPVIKTTSIKENGFFIAPTSKIDGYSPVEVDVNSDGLSDMGYTDEEREYVEQNYTDVFSNHSREAYKAWNPATTDASSFFASSSRWNRLIYAPKIDTSNVTNMRRMFSRQQALQYVPQLNTSKVKNMEYIFDSCYDLREFEFIGGVPSDCVVNTDRFIVSSATFYYNLPGNYDVIINAMGERGLKIAIGEITIKVQITKDGVILGDGENVKLQQRKGTKDGDVLKEPVSMVYNSVDQTYECQINVTKEEYQKNSFSDYIFLNDKLIGRVYPHHNELQKITVSPIVMQFYALKNDAWLTGEELIERPYGNASTISRPVKYLGKGLYEVEAGYSGGTYISEKNSEELERLDIYSSSSAVKIYLGNNTVLGANLWDVKILKVVPKDGNPDGWSFYDADAYFGNRSFTAPSLKQGEKTTLKIIVPKTAVRPNISFVQLGNSELDYCVVTDGAGNEIFTSKGMATPNGRINVQQDGVANITYMKNSQDTDESKFFIRNVRWTGNYPPYPEV